MEDKFSPARFKHMCNPGDLIASMAAMKAFWLKTGRQIIICQQLNCLANYYIGAVHPTLNEHGQNVMMNNKMWEMIKPLLLSQPYIAAVEEYKGQKIDVDLDLIRSKFFVNLPYGAIQQWVMIGYPDLAYDLSDSWIDIKEYDNFYQNKIIVNFTERYRSSHINYFFLKQYQDDLLFAGTDREHELFNSQWDLSIKKIDINNFYELAIILNSCCFLLSNQSMQWNLQEAMKKPRLLELSTIAPNCQPFIGKKSFGYLHQVAVEYYFKLLYNGR